MAAAERRQMIVKVAFSLIAREGFEGFRTQSVADGAGITGATLHYYFPTKQDLVEAVATHLANRYASERAPWPADGGDLPDALKQLRRQFADFKFYRQRKPELLAVSREFLIRAMRDPAVAKVIGPLNEHWRRDFEGILRSGQKEGVFRGDLDSETVSVVIAGALWGASSLFPNTPAGFKKLCGEIERMLSPTEPKGPNA
jgi:AcrR family transcriptional regulator